MQNRRICLALAFALCLSLGFTFVLMKTSTAAPAPTENAHFKGKVVMVNLKSKQTFYLEQVQIRKLGERYFVVGKGSDVNEAYCWGMGKLIWSPVEDIELFIEYESREDYKKEKEKIDNMKSDVDPAKKQKE